MKKLFSFIMLYFLIAINGTFAQDNIDAAVPMDPAVRTGKLPNGITYYVRHNAEPKDRASFYIIQNVGALLENDKQNGLAHFLEHMAFNGTKNFPGKGITETLQKFGIAFGRNINAYTAHNETVYNISEVPTKNEALLDTCLLILHDWSNKLTLDHKEIDNERGVISEEWRTRRTSQFRIQQQFFKALFKDSKYAERDVIGDLDVIKTFNYQTIQDFYHDWYRTDLQAIAVVGDFDIDLMEQKIKTLFSKIPVVENPQARPFFEIPAHQETYFALATDKEAQQSIVSLYIMHPSATKENKNLNYLKEQIVNQLFSLMVNDRIGELLQKGNPPFINGDISYNNIVRGYDVYSIAAIAKPNEEEVALEAILTENERIKRHGFTTSELERAKANMLVYLESMYKEKDKRNNENYIKEIQENFLTAEPMPDFDYYYNFAKSIIPAITVEEVSAKVKEWYKPENRTVFISGPSENAKHLTQEEALSIITKVENTDVAPYQDQVSNASLISEELKGSKITATQKLPEFNAEEWTLANGAKVVFRKTDYEKDKVALYAFSEGGTSLYDIDLLPSANMTSNFVNAYGLGDLDAINLGKMLSGKKVSTSVSLNSLYETVSGSTTPNDFETMLQLVYLTFEKPRFDQEAHEAIMSRNKAAIVNMAKNPKKIIQDSLAMILNNNSPRVLLMSEKLLEQVELGKIEKIYKDRFQDASEFTFLIVGNIDAETVKPLVEKYIGAITSTYRKESWKDNNIRGPKGNVTKKIMIPQETTKATVFIQYSKDMKYSLYNNLCLDILEGVLELRYTENIREKEGGTYGVGVRASVVKRPYENYSIMMQFDCDPDKAQHLKSLVYQEIQEMMAKGPTEEELDKITKNMLKEREQSKHYNSYWMNALHTQYINGYNSTDPKNYENIIHQITPKDITKFSRILFKKADVVDLIFESKN